MSKFVNYKKRSVALPPGCKDLIDVLQSHKNSKLLTGIDTSAVPPDQQIAVTRDESAAGRLADIEKYLSMVFDSRAWAFMLTISLSGEQFTLEVDRAPDVASVVMASVVVQSNSDQEKAVRSFFARRGLHLPDDWGVPPQFVPDVPWQITYEIAPCPSHAAQLSKLLVDLSREALGLNDESQLCFQLHEITKAA
jgi:hypothetical protein